MKRLLAVIFLLFLLCGCSTGTEADVFEYAPSEEERLTVFTCLDESVYEPLVKEFEERTGIWVQVETGSAPALMERIAKGETCDLFLGGEADFLEANKALFQTCETEAKLLDWCPEGKNWVPLSLRPLVIIYNTKLVRQNLPTGWECLLSDAWKGEIAFADPEVSDVSRTVLQALLWQNPHTDPEKILTACAGNLDQLLASTQEVVSQVADGGYCLAVVPEDAALRQIADGAEIAVVYPEKGTYLAADCMAIPKSCTHLENAKAFLEFALSEDAQQHACMIGGRGPVLEELSQLPKEPRYYDAVEAGNTQSSLMETWEKIWGVAP